MDGWLRGYDFYLNLDPATSDDNIILEGWMVGTGIYGTYAYYGIDGGPEPIGTYFAIKVPSPPVTAGGPAP